MTSRLMRYSGLALTGLVVLFLAMDAGMKIVAAPVSIAATGKLGFSPEITRSLGFILAAIAVLYAVPRTSVLGAILLTGYLGGAVAVQLQHGAPIASHVLFGVYLGVFAWAALWLRSPDLRTLIPMRE